MPSPHQTYGTAEHALKSLLLVIAQSEERWGETVPHILKMYRHNRTLESFYEYALRVGMEIKS